jgi:hypothetical protein
LKKLNKTKLGIVAVILLLGTLLIATPVSANVIVRPSGTTIIDYFHIGLVFNVPYNANYHPYVGGINQWALNTCTSSDHRNPQQWTWQSYGSGKSVLLIPKTYAACSPTFAWNIYFEFYKSYWV